jgi:hypothetical protein
MLHNESLVTSLFKMLNVVIITGTIVYFFKTRFLEKIKQAMMKEKLYLLSLENEKKQNILLYAQARQEQEAQRSLAEQLVRNIAVWNKYEEESYIVRQREQKERLEKIRGRKKIQNSFIVRSQIYSKIAPASLDQVQQELEKKFTDAHAQDVYVKKLLVYLSKFRRDA